MQEKLLIDISVEIFLHLGRVGAVDVACFSCFDGVLALEGVG